MQAKDSYKQGRLMARQWLRKGPRPTNMIAERLHEYTTLLTDGDDNKPAIVYELYIGYISQLTESLSRRYA